MEVNIIYEFWFRTVKGEVTLIVKKQIEKPWFRGPMVIQKQKLEHFVNLKLDSLDPHPPVTYKALSWL